MLILCWRKKKLEGTAYIEWVAFNPSGRFTLKLTKRDRVSGANIFLKLIKSVKHFENEYNIISGNFAEDSPVES